MKRIISYSIIFLTFVVSSTYFGQTQYPPPDYYDNAPDNFRRVGKLNILVRHAFPADYPNYYSKNMRDPNRDKVVDDKMLEFLKNENVEVIFDVADLWTEEEIIYAREKFGIEVTKRINLNKAGFSTKEKIAAALNNENINFFLQKIKEAEKNNTKVSVHCRGGMHRAGIGSAVYLIEKEGHSPEEAVHYWKSNATEEDFERYLQIIGSFENWDEDKIDSVRLKYGESLYPKEFGPTLFLHDYKKDDIQNNK